MTAAGSLKLGGFSVSRVLKKQETKATTFVGTPYYISPEVWKKQPYCEKVL